jgi:hypothetical protein
MSFGTYNWAVEGRWYVQPGHSLLHNFNGSLQEFRACSGRWTGLPTFATNRLPGGETPEVALMQARSCIGLNLLHDIPQKTHTIPRDLRGPLNEILERFGWFDDRTEWVPYWRTGKLVSVTADREVAATVYLNRWSYGGPRALVVLFNAGEKEAKVRFGAKEALLGRPAATVTDAEAKKPAPKTLEIGRHDYRLLIVE